MPDQPTTSRACGLAGETASPARRRAKSTNERGHRTKKNPAKAGLKGQGQCVAAGPVDLLFNSTAPRLKRFEADDQESMHSRDGAACCNRVQVDALARKNFQTISVCHQFRVPRLHET